jgi:hypothetical protein
MAWISVSCPQCGAPLPRVAIWRTVKCGSCGALITRTESVVSRDTFRQALARARHQSARSGQSIECAGERYQLGELLGGGEISQVFRAQRLGALPLLATVKLSSAPAAASRYAREAQVLRELQALGGGGDGAYFSQRLPEVMAQGAVEGTQDRHALVLRHPNGFWGSLASLNERYPQGLDSRHAVWIWRRLLEILGFIHRQGWAHGDVRPEHALVHPQDHGIRLIGWASAQGDARATLQAADLVRSARLVSVLLIGAGETDAIPGHVPTGLAQLVTRAGQDEQFCREQGAAGLDGRLQAAARAAFGPPAFVSLAV